MKIYRDGKEYELTMDEVVSAWIEHQEELNRKEKETWRCIIRDNIQKFSYDKTKEDAIVTCMLDDIYIDVKKRGVDSDWALGIDEHYEGNGGLCEYFLDAMMQLDLEID